MSSPDQKADLQVGVIRDTALDIKFPEDCVVWELKHKNTVLEVFTSTLCTLRWEYKFSILIFLHFLWSLSRELVKQSGTSWVCGHFLYSHDLNVWFRGENVGRN